MAIENKNGTEALETDIFIDSTGNADLAPMAGVPMLGDEGRPLQPLSTYFKVLGGVDPDSQLIKNYCLHYYRAFGSRRLKSFDYQEYCDLVCSLNVDNCYHLHSLPYFR